MEEDDSYKFKDEETSQSEEGYDREYEQGDLDPSRILVNLSTTKTMSKVT